ncbi:MAG: hypothetical protein JWO05_2808 [Gemmatimonadetes bacterium]|nr:hypothetical protein [Gemmatimonadota bacterium]
MLRVEAFAVLAAGIVAYRALGGSWPLFAALFLAPDLSMAGYVRGPRTGAAAYNAVHSYTAPAVLAGLMALGAVPAHWGLCVIWVSHIGFDRALGYGLKFPSAFRYTHLGQLGGERSKVQQPSPA